MSEMKTADLRKEFEKEHGRLIPDIVIHRTWWYYAMWLESKALQPAAGMQELVNLLAKHGGKIVSSNSLPPEWINQARASGRLYVDENSLGYVWEPDIDGFPDTEEKVKQFEKWYPLEIELPDELKEWKPDLRSRLPQQGWEDIIPFAEWAAEHYFKAHGTWIPRYADQRNKDNWITSANLYAKYKQLPAPGNKEGMGG